MANPNLFAAYNPTKILTVINIVKLWFHVLLLSGTSEMMKMYEEWLINYNRVHKNLEEKDRRRFKIFRDNVEHLSL